MALTWTAGGNPSAGTYNAGAGNAAGVFVFVGSSGKVVRSGDGGLTWTTATLPGSLSAAYCVDVVWDPVIGLFAIGTNNGGGGDGGILTSPDGITWTTRFSTSSSFICRNVASNGAGLLAAAVAAGGSETLYYSTNGTAWNTFNLLTVVGGQSPTSLGGGAGRLVLRDNLARTWISTSGAAWTAGGVVGGVGAVFSDGAGLYSGEGSGIQSIKQSLDNGVTWTSQNTGGDSSYGRGAAVPGRIVLLEDGGANTGIRSWDADPASLATWAGSSVPGGVITKRLASNGVSRFVVVGSGVSAYADFGAPPPASAFWTDFVGTYEAI